MFHGIIFIREQAPGVQVNLELVRTMQYFYPGDGFRFQMEKKLRKNLCMTEK
jgi:hypothetical protein